MNENQYLKIVEGFGLYHVFASLPLAIPIVSEFVLSIFGQLHSALGFNSAWSVFDATTLLFVNLFAALAVCWGLLRWRHPSRIIGRYEGVAMIAFTLIVVWRVLQGASPLWLVIAIVDGIGAILHLRPIKQ